MHQNSLSDYGQVTSVAPQLLNAGDIPREGFLWTPGTVLQQYLPAGFTISFEVLKLGEHRRVRATEDYPMSWALAGAAILTARGQLGAETEHCYHSMRLITTLGSHIRERLPPRRFSAKDIAATTERPQGILPDDFGPPGEGHRWTVERMLSEGAQAARQDGIVSPSQHDKVVYGIDAEARIHPYELTRLSHVDISRLIRLAIFDTPPSDQPLSGRIKELVFGRLMQAIRKKEDFKQAEFAEWFHTRFDNVVHSIAKQKGDGGPIDRPVVRTAIIELIYDSWTYLAQTIDCYGGLLAATIDPPLTDDSLATFNVLYRSSPQLANLPLVLLGRIPIAKPSIARLLDDPVNVECWGQFLRVLYTYGHMVSSRREADRLKKRGRGVRFRALGLNDLTETRNQPDGNRWDEVVKRMGLRCRCGSATFESSLGPYQGEEFTLNCHCQSCGTIISPQLSVEQCRRTMTLLSRGSE